jgi:hypothetical protein
VFCPNRRFPSFYFAALAAALVLCAGVGFSSAEPTEELADFEGDWRQLDPELDQESRVSAIDHAIGGLSWVTRTMAGPMLRRTTAPPPRMQFVWDGGRFQQRILEREGSRVREIELDRGALDGKDMRGEPVTRSWGWTEDGLRLSWVQHQARGHNTYRVDADSGTLIVEHTIQITAISDVEPIVFESRFGRQSPPPVAAAESLQANPDSRGSAAPGED